MSKRDNIVKLFEDPVETIESYIKIVDSIKKDISGVITVVVLKNNEGHCVLMSDSIDYSDLANSCMILQKEYMLATDSEDYE